MNNFKDYGFEADFEGEILKEFDEFYIGWATHCDGSGVTPCKWYKHSNKYKFKSGTERQNNRSLTPIKKEWYENPDNFPCIIISLKTNKPHIAYNYNHLEEKIKQETFSAKPDKFRPATKDEVLALLIKA